MGKETKKRVDICIYITDSLCYTPETNTMLLINCTPMENKNLKESNQTMAETKHMIQKSI